MQNDIIFKTIKTPHHSYVYDRHTNAIVKLTEDEYDDLKQVESGQLVPAESAVIRKYQEQGMFMPNVVKEIRHPKSGILKYHAENSLHQLILQVTQQCNLRCSYCVYSGNYKHTRTHSNKRMSFETAKKAIDFFLARSTEKAEIVVGFYGGEPLLEFELIQRCVEYLNSQVEGKRIKYNMTTNGTLLTESIVDYLVEQDIQIHISLDGSKEEHDANRRFANAKGSFDVILENIRKIKEAYPEYEKNIVILTTINPHNHLQCVLEFFDADETLNDNHIIFSNLVENNLREEVMYDREFYRVRNYEYIKMLFSLAGKLDKKHVSRLMQSSRGYFNTMKNRLHSHEALAPPVHHGGPCLPGVQRLFVDVNGALYPCERVSEDLEFYKIGTLDTGFNLEKMQKILNIGKITEEECKTCWNLRNCSLCSSRIEFDTEPTKETKMIECKKICDNTFFDMYELCVLSEFGHTESEWFL